MIKFEMHAHTKGSSRCGHSDAKTLIADYVKEGYGGVVITNHLDDYSYYNVLVGDTHKQKTDYFFSQYEKVKEEGKKFNVKVFFGVEVRDENQTEYMLYGFKRAFLYDNKPLFTFSQKELFKLSEKYNLFMYQTHPFRSGVNRGNPEYMHGVEIFNGYFHHVNNNQMAREFADKFNLIKMVGTDYHRPNQPLTAYMNIPEFINDEQALAEYLLGGKTEYFGNEEYYIREMKKYKGE